MESVPNNDLSAQRKKWPSESETIKGKLKSRSKQSQAEKLVNSMSVKRYVFKPSGRVIWIVVGRKREYLVIPKLYCQCDNFYIKAVIKKETDQCYHMVAQSLAETSGIYETFEIPDSDFIRLNNEWKKQSE